MRYHGLDGPEVAALASGLVPGPVNRFWYMVPRQKLSHDSTGLSSIIMERLNL